MSTPGIHTQRDGISKNLSVVRFLSIRVCRHVCKSGRVSAILTCSTENTLYFPSAVTRQASGVWRRLSTDGSS